jgi:hypothetical protein
MGNKMINSGKMRFCKLVLFIIFLPMAGFFLNSGHAGDSSADPDKLAVIELIEDRLATAYTVRSDLETLDYGTLDRIYPDWHNGDPAEARRTLDGCRIHIVSYEVHSVFFTQPGMAEVKGEKQVALLRRVKFLKFFHRTKKETSKARFNIICRRDESGTWEIIKETEG